MVTEIGQRGAFVRIRQRRSDSGKCLFASGHGDGTAGGVCFQPVTEIGQQEAFVSIRFRGEQCRNEKSGE